MLINPCLPLLGKTYNMSNPPSVPDTLQGGYGQSVQLEGSVMTHKAIERVPEDNGVRKPIGGLELTCLLVRNTTAGAILPGQMVNWDYDFRGRRVNQVNPTSTVSHRNAGIADSWLPAAGVAIGDLFWLVVNGVCYVRADADDYETTNVLVCSTATAGQLLGKTSAYALGDIGFPLETKTTSSGDPYLLSYVNMPYLGVG